MRLSKEKENSINKKIRKKITSETGASISFALLLFLVCAALSAVVLVAGTTAAGRISSLKENDQRYYAVTSAAELICELMNGKTATVAGSEAFAMPVGQISKEVYDAGQDTTKPVTLPVFSAQSVGQGSKDLTLSGSAVPADALAVTITESVAADGTATFVLKSKVKASKKAAPFKIVITFTADNSTETLPYKKEIDQNGDTGAKESGVNATEYTWHFDKMVSSYEE